MIEFPAARAGQELSAAMWEAARAAVRASRVRGGSGIRVKETADGSIISAAEGPATWNHPFRVELLGSRARITPGTVNGIEPRIDGVPLSGTDEDPPPVLAWEKLKLGDDGRGYVAIELECDAHWKIAPERLTVVQVAEFDTEDGEPFEDQSPALAGGVPGLPGRRARYPLALLIKRASGAVDAVQIVHFALQHRAAPRTADATIARHFFW